MTRSLARRYGLGCSLALLVGALAACSDASLGVVGGGISPRLEVHVDGPLSSLGAWRYYDGVRLLECDVRITATAEGGSVGSTAQWLDAVVDLYDLHTGQYLASDYMYLGEVEQFWGSRWIESGERVLSRSLRYTSYGPFRAYFVFRYRADGVNRRTEHRFDCR